MNNLTEARQQWLLVALLPLLLSGFPATNRREFRESERRLESNWNKAPQLGKWPLIEGAVTSVVWMESGSDATFDTSPWSGVTGSPASSTTQHRTGPRSIKCDSGAGNAATNPFKTGVLADAGRCYSFGIYFESLNSADSSLVTEQDTGHVLACWALRLQASDHTLAVMNGSGTKLKGGATVFATGQWYRISVSRVLTATNNFTIKIYVNGTLECTSTNADGSIARVASDELTVGWTTAPGASKVCYIDDIYVDNRTDLTDCGNVHVTAKRPFSNGTANGLTTQIGSGNSGYGSGHADEVNERVRSDSNGWSLSLASAGGTVTEEYSLEAASAGDEDISASDVTIVGLLGWLQANAATATNNTNNLILAGSNTAITLTTTSAHYFAVSTTATYPAGNTDIGMTSATSSTARLFRLFEAGVLVAYTLTARTATPGVLALSLSTFAPAVSRAVVPPVKALSLTAFAPSALAPRLATPGLVALTTAKFAPVITVGVTATPGVKALTTSLLAPTVSAPRLVTPGVLAVTTAKFAPVVSAPRLATPGLIALSTALFAPTAAAPRLATPGLIALTTTGFAPTVSVTVTPVSNTTVTPDTFPLRLHSNDRLSVNLGIYVPLATLSLTGSAPVVSFTARVSVRPTKVTLVATRYAPLIVRPILSTPGTDNESTHTWAPDVRAPRLVTPGVKALTTSLFAPTASKTTGTTARPNLIALVVTTFAPAARAPRTATPPKLSLTTTKFAPAVSRAVNIRLLALTLTLFAPTVTRRSLKRGVWNGAAGVLPYRRQGVRTAGGAPVRPARQRP